MGGGVGDLMSLGAIVLDMAGFVRKRVSQQS
jgi:hypothetical protein